MLGILIFNLASICCISIDTFNIYAVSSLWIYPFLHPLQRL